MVSVSARKEGKDISMEGVYRVQGTNNHHLFLHHSTDMDVTQLTGPVS